VQKQLITVARTADGHPDLSGIYDVATMTPLQRPAEFGNRRALTNEEAAEMEPYEKQRQDKSAQPSNPDREAPPVGGDKSPTHSYLETLFRFGGGVVGGYNTAENLHVIERFSRLADGNLLYQFTVEDPTTWDRAWTGEYPWRVTPEQLYEYACHEGNYALSNVLSGAARATKKTRRVLTDAGSTR
jgi:hypothetical protein